MRTRACLIILMFFAGYLQLLADTGLNDCATAVPMTLPFDTSDVSVYSQGDDVDICGFGNGEDVFFEFTAGSDSCLVFFIGYAEQFTDPADVCVSFHRGCPEAGGGFQLFSDTASGPDGAFEFLFVPVQKDSTYYLVLDGSTDFVWFDIAVHYAICSSSTCETALFISLPYMDSVYFSDDVGDNSACPGNSNDIYFKFTADYDTTIVINTFPSNLGKCLFENCPDSSGSQLIEILGLGFKVHAGNTYYLVVEADTASEPTGVSIDYLCAYYPCYHFTGSGDWTNTGLWDTYPGTSFAGVAFITDSSVCTATNITGNIVNDGDLTLTNGDTLLIIFNRDSLNINYSFTKIYTGSKLVNDHYAYVNLFVDGVTPWFFEDPDVFEIYNYGNMDIASVGADYAGDPMGNVLAYLYNLDTINNLNSGFYGFYSALNHGDITGGGIESELIYNYGTIESELDVQHLENYGSISGPIIGNFVVNKGLISPDGEIDTHEVSNLFLQQGNAAITFRLSGSSGPGVTNGHDQLSCDTMAITGTLIIDTLNYTPAVGDSFEIITSSSVFLGWSWFDFDEVHFPALDSCKAWGISYGTTYDENNNASRNVIVFVEESPDSDGDGVQDCDDLCPEDPDKVVPGLCGCGIPDTDANGNGLSDCLESAVRIYRQGNTITDGPGIAGHSSDSTQLWYLGSPSDTDTSVVLVNRRQDALQFATDNTLRMTIDSAGNVGIGRTPTDHRLEVQGDASKSVPGDWLANSDARLKKNIQPLDPYSSLERLLLLRGVSFEWNDTLTGYARPVKPQIGITAQHMQRAFPDLVKTGHDGYLMTSYGTLDPVFIEALRALHDEVSALKQLNIQLFERIDALHKQIESNKRKQ